MNRYVEALLVFVGFSSHIWTEGIPYILLMGLGGWFLGRLTATAAMWDDMENKE